MKKLTPTEFKTTLDAIASVAPNDVRRAAEGLMINLPAPIRDGEADPAACAAYFAVTLGLTTKAAYLEHRDALRQHIRILAALQKAHSTRMRQPYGDSDAQQSREKGRLLVTRLIALRRAGKRWSAETAREAMAQQEVTAAA